MIFVNRDRQSLGQFSEQDVSNGLESGRFLPDDLAWQEGMESWQPLSSLTHLPPPGAAIPAVDSLPPSLDGPPAGFEKPGNIRFDECLSKAWDCFQRNWGLCVVGTLILFAISAVVQIPMQFAQAVLERFTGHGSSAQIGIMIGMVVVFLFFYALATGVSTILSAGFMYFFIESLRTGKSNIDNLFAGFRASNWIQLLLAMLVWILAVFIIVAVLVAPGIFLTATMKSSVPVIVAGVLAIIPLIYLAVPLGFVFPLIVDKKIGFWQAVTAAIRTVHRQWFQVLGLMILVGLIAMAGMLACCVGMLATMPLGYLIWCQGYRQLFGDGDLPNA
ncbi:MAG: GYF domain-containing protein [Verrucomicrobia bacterium]|nr:GYF domain-containing protein [Verrucomicrobiota bacterium]